MILLFLSAILLVFSAQIFALNFSIQGLNRAIINTPIELMYRTVYIGSSDVQFDSKKFEIELLKYYDQTLSRYSKERTIDFNPDLKDNGNLIYPNDTIVLPNFYE